MKKSGSEEFCSQNMMENECIEKFHLDGTTLTETSFLKRVPRWDPASGKAEFEADTRHVAMVLRDHDWRRQGRSL